MRDFKGMKRQRGRNRGGGGKPQHNANRAFESNGPEGIKVRGAAQAIFERYQQLARDAASAGDRVLAENHLQHAEHYFRTLRAMQPQRPVSEIYGRDQYSSGFDIDFEAEPEEATVEQPGEGAPAEEGAEGGGETRQDDRPREERRDRWENRDNRDRQRDDRPRDDRPREDRQRDDRPRDGEGRRDRDRFDRRDRWRDREDRRRDEQPREPAAAVERPAPVEENAPVLRSEDGEVSHAPAFLGRAPAAEEAAPKPRRRRAPRAEGSAKAETEEA